MTYIPLLQPSFHSQREGRGREREREMGNIRECGGRKDRVSWGGSITKMWNKKEKPKRDNEVIWVV